jgi:redox-sensitive bicupin YhaK (pirin superfamily)
MIDLRKAADRGRADFGWLDSRHTFSFGEYYDPLQQGFSDLRVINDDRVQPNQGFGTHPHRDMEIVSYVLEGALEHKDSMGTGSVIRPGDVQIMSAGTGVRHSEFNHSAAAPVHFLQIWIVPNVKGAKPRYQQTRFSESEKRGRMRLILSPQGDNGSLEIRQDVRVFAGLFSDGESGTFALQPDHFAYVHVARGSLLLNGVRLQEGDGARLREEQAMQLSEGRDAEVLAFELRPQEMPSL